MYGNLGNVFRLGGEYQKAKEYYEKALAIAIEIGDKQVQSTSYSRLGSVFESLGEYQKAKEYYEKALAIAIESGDKKIQSEAYNNFANVFFQLRGEYQKAKEYYEKALVIAIEIGNRKRKGRSYGKLGNVFQSLGEHQKAEDYRKKALAIAIVSGDRKFEGELYRSFGKNFLLHRKYFQVKFHYDKALTIATEIGDRPSEMECYTSLAYVLCSIHDYQTAKEHNKKALAISIEIGDIVGELISLNNLGDTYRSVGEYVVAEELSKEALFISREIGAKMFEFKILLGISFLKSSQLKHEDEKTFLLESIQRYEQLRNSLGGNKEFEISLLEKYGSFPYKRLSDLLCDLDSPRDALYVEELGRARGLAESLASKFSVVNHISADPKSWFGIENIVSKERGCVFLYISYFKKHTHLWVLKGDGDVNHRISSMVEDSSLVAESLFNVEGIFKKSAVKFGVKLNENCEGRSLQGCGTKDDESLLHLCYKLIFAPVGDLLTEPEIIIVPEKCSYRVPFAALRADSAGKYLSEAYRIRIVPSLTTLGVIQKCPADYHSQTGALVVGDPRVGKVCYKGRLQTFTALASARQEAKMVGQLLGVHPLLGECATKQAVLRAIHSVSLIHIAAHGDAERGEVILSPQGAANKFPQEEDYILTVSDISKVQLRAKLVVLSCCHSGRGVFKQEGVIGIARAFLASGARSVLAASWAIEDEASKQLMDHFYEHLANGESASESLHQATKWLRRNGFTKISQWAPFVLIGDNVTFDFTKMR